MALTIDAGLERIQNGLEIASGGSGYTTWLEFENTGNTGRISTYLVAVTYKIDNETTNDDNSISFDFHGISQVVVSSSLTGNNEDVGVVYDLWVDQNNDGGLENVYHKDTKMTDKIGFTKDFNASHVEHYTIPPQQWLQVPKRRLLHWLASGKYASDEFYYTVGGGKGIFNNNPATYKPMAVRQGNDWKTLNVKNGHIDLRDSGKWVNKATESNATVNQLNKGHNQYYDNGWYQQGIKGN